MSSQGSSGVAADSESGQIHYLLVEWGRWVRTGRPEMDPNSMFKLGSTVPTPMISDDLALVVDRIVARLRYLRPDMGRCVMLYYARGWESDGKTGQHMRPRRSESAARYIRHACLAWIDGVIAEKLNELG